MPEKHYYMGDRFIWARGEEYILAFTVDYTDKNVHYFQLISAKTGTRFSDTVIKHKRGSWTSISEEEMKALCEGDFDDFIYKPTGERD